MRDVCDKDIENPGCSLSNLWPTKQIKKICWISKVLELLLLRQMMSHGLNSQFNLGVYFVEIDKRWKDSTKLGGSPSTPPIYWSALNARLTFWSADLFDFMAFLLPVVTISHPKIICLRFRFCTTACAQLICTIHPALLLPRYVSFSNREISK